MSYKKTLDFIFSSFLSSRFRGVDCWHY